MAHALRRATAAAATASVIVSLPSLLALTVAPARAIPRLDLTPYPKPTAQIRAVLVAETFRLQIKRCVCHGI